MGSRRILLIDDSAVVLAAARHALVGAGYEVGTVLTLEELAAQDLSCFDLILMDVEMPELYGDSIASVLKHERGVKAPIYLFSSLAKEELEQLARDAEVDGWISKQDGMQALVVRVQTIISSDAR